MHVKKKQINSGCILHVRKFFLISDQRAFNARLQKKRQNGVKLQLVLHKTIIGFGLYKIAKLSRLVCAIYLRPGQITKTLTLINLAIIFNLIQLKDNIIIVDNVINLCYTGCAIPTCAF